MRKISSYSTEAQEALIPIVSEDCTVEKKIKVVFNSKGQADDFRGMCFSWE